MDLDADNSLKLLALSLALAAYISNVRRDMAKACAALRAKKTELDEKLAPTLSWQTFQKGSRSIGIERARLSQERDAIRDKIAKREREIAYLMIGEIPLVLAGLAIFAHWIAQCYSKNADYCVGTDTIFFSLALYLLIISAIALMLQHVQQWDKSCRNYAEQRCVSTAAKAAIQSKASPTGHHSQQTTNLYTQLLCQSLIKNFYLIYALVLTIGLLSMLWLFPVTRLPMKSEKEMTTVRIGLEFADREPELECSEDYRVGPFSDGSFDRVGDDRNGGQEQFKEQTRKVAETLKRGRGQRRLVALVVVGSADKRPLRHSTDSAINSNAGLAQQRALSVKHELEAAGLSVPIITLDAGPSTMVLQHNHTKHEYSQILANDRTARVCAFWETDHQAKQEQQQ